MSRPETVLSPRSSLSSSPFSSASSIDSPLISGSISGLGEHSRDSQRGIHSSRSSGHSSRSSSPMTPWNLRPDLELLDRQQDHPSREIRNQDDDNNDDDHNLPPLYLGHNRWKQTQKQGQQRFASDPLPHTPGQHHRTLSLDRTNVHGSRVVLHRRTKSKSRHVYKNVYHERNLSRDFFLILTLCFVLACFLICLARPALVTWYSDSASLLGLDE